LLSEKRIIDKFYVRLIFKIPSTEFMTEQKLVNPSLETESISKKSGISWKELQGLSWLFIDDDF